jgi:hypothetical protein
MWPSTAPQFFLFFSPTLISFCVAAVEKQIASSSSIKCDGGKKTIKKEYINDDYCDCEDGSDEPGTSACANAKFFCRNTGHLPLTIPAQWVDDGHCGAFKFSCRAKVPQFFFPLGFGDAALDLTVPSLRAGNSFLFGVMLAILFF